MISESRKSELFYRFFLIFIFTIPISRFLSVRFLVALLLLSFFLGNRKDSARRFANQAWDALFYLLVLVLGLVYSEDLPTGWKVIETSLGLIAVPFVFRKFVDFNKQRLTSVFQSFALGLFIASLICLVNAGSVYYREGKWGVFFSSALTDVINSHPTYFAYYLITIITFGLYQLYYEKTNAILVVAFLSFFFLILMLTGGITAFVSLLLVLSFFVLKYLLEQKTRRQTLTFVVVVLMIACTFVFNSLTVREKNDYWERLVLWESALRANPNIILGVGTGDYKKILNEYYLSHDLSTFADSSYNSHNQFIEILFSNGLIGVLSLSILLGRPLYFSVRNQDILGTLTFFPFTIYGMTEVFLGRYQGVVFFAVLHQVFMVYYLGHKPTFSLKDV